MSKYARHVVWLLVAALAAPALAQAPAPMAPAASDKAAVRIAADRAVSNRVLDEVAKLRGLPVLRPVTNGLKSRDDIRAIVLRDLSESTTPAEMHDTSVLLRFLGLVPADFELERETVALLTEQIAGFYDPKTKVFYLADWIPIPEQQTIMAHELTHALADQHFDLRRFEKWPDGDGDAELAARALIEGDATAVMIEYGLAERGVAHDLGALPVSIADLLREGARAQDPEHPVFSNAPEVMRESLQFPYVAGVGFVQALLKAGSWPRVSDAYRALPASTEQALHPEKYLAGERPVAVALPDVSALLGTGWRRVDEDVNGEFGYYLILKDKLPEREAAAAAAGWGGDRYGFYVDASRTTGTLVHVSVWDSDAEATEFFAAYVERTVRRYGLTDSGAAGPNAKQWVTSEGIARVERVGNRVFVVEGFRGADIAPIFKRLLQ
jgi:hypothetical protein